MSEYDEEHVTVAARHLDEHGDIWCDDGAGLWVWERTRPEHVERALFDAQMFIVSHVCEVAR
ncbi:hypothetical protein V2J52_02750 [Georgenia sp. MJ173]|uniref:hypothetical protein n=1 Tax=Georgenia sunbinii TaxID=3117728 RepID=UPI002F263C7C